MQNPLRSKRKWCRCLLSVLHTFQAAVDSMCVQSPSLNWRSTGKQNSPTEDPLQKGLRDFQGTIRDCFSFLPRGRESFAYHHHHRHRHYPLHVCSRQCFQIDTRFMPAGDLWECKQLCGPDWTTSYVSSGRFFFRFCWAWAAHVSDVNCRCAARGSFDPGLAKPPCWAISRSRVCSNWVLFMMCGGWKLTRILSGSGWFVWLPRLKFLSMQNWLVLAETPTNTIVSQSWNTQQAKTLNC